MPYTPFVTYTFHYILGNYFHIFHLILPCVSFLCILLSVFYVLIHALCVSVHFRAISKCYHNYQKLIKGVLEDILLSLRLSVIETTSLGDLHCLHYGESKFSLYMQAVRLVCEHLLCRHTPFKIQNPCVIYKVFTCFLCGCSLVRVTTRWWMLMVAPIYISYASVRVFSHGVFSVLSSPVLSLRSRSSRFATLGRGGSGGFRGITFFARYPLGHILIVSCRIPFSCVFGGGGGERENKLLSIIIMHSCNPNDRVVL